jgi:hypothetical protein
MPDDFYDKPNTFQDPPVAISHIVRTLRSYLPIIALSIGAIMVGYLILAVTIYVLAPSQAVTTLRFRVDFKGAELGEYPNGTKFSSAEIITAPVLLKAFNANDLGRFTTFGDFTKSIFVLESNTAQDTLSREYQARLNDPKLSPIERDRLQREYESKLASLSKDQYSLNYLRPSRVRGIPEVIVQKSLNDILNGWADFVSKEQHVLEYRVALLSPNSVAGSPGAGTDPIVATQKLRSSVMHIQYNITTMRRIPAAELVRTKKEELSLYDLAARLEEIHRFQLDPLVESIAASNLLTNRPATLRFLETQLAYDRRQYEGHLERAEAARRALAMYMSARMSHPEVDLGAGSGETSTPAPPRGDGVTPQLSDTFLDRVIQLTANSADSTYRKMLTEEYREAALSVVPYKQEVAYDEAVIAVIRGASGGGGGMTVERVDQQLTATRDEVRRILLNVHEIHAAVSRNMNPSTQLLTRLGVPATQFERSIGIKKLALYGVLTIFIALPIIVVLCLLHNRIREEEAAEATVSSVRRTAESTV